MDKNAELLYEAYLDEHRNRLSLEEEVKTLEIRLDKVLSTIEQESKNEETSVLQNRIKELSSKVEELKESLVETEKIATVKTEKVKDISIRLFNSAINQLCCYQNEVSFKGAIQRIYNTALAINDRYTISIYENDCIMLTDNKDLLEIILKKCRYHKDVETFLEEVKKNNIAVYWHDNSIYTKIQTCRVLNSVYGVKRVILLSINKCKERGYI